MKFYFNELSLHEMHQDDNEIETNVSHFVGVCLDLEKIGFKELRSHIYLLDIQLPTGLRLATWVKDRHHGNRDLKTRFKNLAFNAPFFSSDEEHLKGKLEWANFTFQKKEALGIGAAFLAESLVVSFKTNPIWEEKALQPVIYEYVENGAQVIKISQEIVLNVANADHIAAHQEFAIKRNNSLEVRPDWRPEKEYLPNVETSNKWLNMNGFYADFKKLSRNEKTAQARMMGKKVAEMNFYKYDPEISALNKNGAHIRDIFVSQNLKGRRHYLSIDVEKGAFEVCDYDGIQQKEILFDGRFSQSQKTDHSIKVK